MISSGNASSSGQFNVLNYKRLEKWNNYANLASVLLMFLSLSVIPIAFFSLRASRESDSILTVANVDLKRVSVMVEILYSEDITAPVGRRPAVAKKPIEISLQWSTAKATNQSFMIVPPVNATFLYFEFRDKCSDSETGSDIGSGYSSIQCFENMRDGALVILPTDSRWKLNSILTYTYEIDSKQETAISSTCESVRCVPQHFLFVTVYRGGKTTLRQCDLTTQSNLFQLSSIAVYGGSRSPIPTFQLFYYEEISKYGVGDNIIDSFAISGIVVSLMLLLITLVKLLLWLFMAPTIKR